MELSKLLHGVSVLSTNADAGAQVRGIKINSKQVEENDIFVCMEGVNDDGNDYIGDIKVPFIAVTEKKPENPDVKYVLVKDVRRSYAIICQNAFSNPAEGMKFIAVVGTNGKTSTAHYLSSILNFAGMKCGLIGTEGHYVDGEKIGQSLTTPDPYEFNELLAKMRARGCDAVISEVSAHAIYLEKTGTVRADIAILTNITQDHLDYFKDFENYSGVKMSYFTAEHVKKAVVNVDDESGRLLLKRLEDEGLPAISYGLYNPADCFAVNVREDTDGVQFVANLNDEIVDCKTKLMGEFNVYNLLSALAVAKELGIDGETLSLAVKRVRAVKGRFSVMRNDKGTIIIDFAHTPESLKQLLSTARTITKSRLITVFGCGGERDESKRKKMGEVASRYSDSIVVTNDNPRGENPAKIISDIESGISIKDVKSIENRFDAVRFALSEMEEGDTLVIAGKGNETYLEVRGRKLPYSDFDVVEKYGQLR